MKHPVNRFCIKKDPLPFYILGRGVGILILFYYTWFQHCAVGMALMRALWHVILEGKVTEYFPHENEKLNSCSSGGWADGMK